MASSRIVKFKCPYCEKRLTRENLVIHVEEEHDDMIPENFTPFRLVFNYVNKKPMDYNGRCTECGSPTRWDENKGRYDRQCLKPACRESYLKKFEENMIRTKGVSRISSTPAGQELMLSKRKISGLYKFQNGKEKSYTGSYELKALQFMDKVMNIDPDDIMAPGPVLEYTCDGVKHFYITDFYYQPYNLIIEVKDGGSRPNNRNMPDYRAKQIAKEKYIIDNTNYNYLRLTDNDLSQLLSIMADLKMQMIEKGKERVIHVNEAMNALMSGYIPGMKDTGSVYIVNYMKNNVFSGETEKGYAISNDCKLSNLICRNKEGILDKAPSDFLEKATYEVYLSDISIEEASIKLSNYIGTFVEEGFLYETLFGKKLYSYDQFKFEDHLTEVIDYYKYMDVYSQIVENYINPDNSNIIKSFDCNNLVCESYTNISNNKYRITSKKFPELYIESNNYMDENSIEYKILESLLLEVN